jgi:hypothetical protein
MSVEVKTRSLLSLSEDLEKVWNPKCRTMIRRNKFEVSVSRYPLKTHILNLDLKGTL